MRVNIKYIPIQRNVFFKRNKSKLNSFIKDPVDYRDKIEEKKSNEKVLIKKRSFYRNPKNMQKDGLTTCEYKILKKYNFQNNPSITRILVSI